MKNARQLKTIALNLLSNAIENMDLKPAEIKSDVPIELSNDDREQVKMLFDTYRSQIADRVESRADRSSKKLAARIKSQAQRAEQIEKKKRAAEQKEQAKEARKSEKAAAVKPEKKTRPAAKQKAADLAPA